MTPCRSVFALHLALFVIASTSTRFRLAIGPLLRLASFELLALGHSSDARNRLRIEHDHFRRQFVEKLVHLGLTSLMPRLVWIRNK